MKESQNIRKINPSDIDIIPRYREFDSMEEINLEFSIPVGRDILTFEYPLFSLCHHRSDAHKIFSDGGMPIFSTLTEVTFFAEDDKTEEPLALSINIDGDKSEQIFEKLTHIDIVLLSSSYGGYNRKMREALRVGKQKFPESHFIISGIKTAEGYDDFAQWGADTIMTSEFWSLHDMCWAKKTRMDNDLRAPLIAYYPLLSMDKSDSTIKEEPHKFIAAGADYFILPQVLRYDTIMRNLRWSMFELGFKSLTSLQENSEYLGNCV